MNIIKRLSPIQYGIILIWNMLIFYACSERHENYNNIFSEIDFKKDSSAKIKVIQELEYYYDSSRVAIQRDWIEKKEEKKVIQELIYFYDSCRAVIQRDGIDKKKMLFPFAYDCGYLGGGGKVSLITFDSANIILLHGKKLIRLNIYFDYDMFNDDRSLLEFAKCKHEYLSESLKRHFDDAYFPLENIYQIEEKRFGNILYLFRYGSGFYFIGYSGQAREVCP